GDGWTWPLCIVAIDDRGRLGYFDSEDLVIGINKCVMYTAKDQVIKDLLRHELAHYFTFIEYRHTGGDLTSHGALFRAVCDKYGLSASVRSATMDVREHNDAIAGELDSEEVIAKIRKLMSLATSDNENEARLATMRANELMVKHNLESIAAAPGAHDVEYCVKQVLPSKRSTPRLSAIRRILREFFVYPVQTSTGLEVTGTRANVENAEYIANFLDRELAAIWKRARAERRGLRQKAFMIALASSYVSKLREARTELPVADKHALAVVDEELEWAVQGVYRGLRSSSSTYRHCAESASRGAAEGSKLNIRRGVGVDGAVKLLGGR
ncbi:MAG: DUF2786 domain-containing protein, partial [Myxococcota bacterium]